MRLEYHPEALRVKRRSAFVSARIALGAAGVALALAQVGQFSFVLATLGRDVGALDEASMNALIPAAILSIMVNPVLYRCVEPLEALLKRHHRPAPRLAAGRLLAKRNLATAMIDISDGLIQDLGHICKASAVGAILQEDKLPLSKAYRALVDKMGMQHALSGGEDYELLFCAAPQQRRRIETLGTQAGVPITRIGVCVPAGKGIRVLDAAGSKVTVEAQGHDHFKKQ